MPLVWGVTRIVPRRLEEHANDPQQLVMHEFLSAYIELRKAVPGGTLKIHLSVEGAPEEVGVDESKLEPPDDRRVDPDGRVWVRGRRGWRELGVYDG